MIPGLRKRVFNFYDVMMYVALARKHLRLITLIACLCLTGCLTYYVWAKPVYYAKALVKVQVTALPMDSEKVFHDSNLTRLASQIGAPHIIERTAHALGLQGDFREISLRYVKKVTVHLNSTGNYDVEAWAYSYSLTKKFPEELVKQFLQFREEQRMQYRQSILDAYQREMTSVTLKMDEVLKQKFTFEDEKDVTKRMIELERFKQLPAQIITLQKRLDEMHRIHNELLRSDLDVVAKLSLIASVEQQDVQVSLGETVKQGTPGLPKEEKDEPPAPNLVVIPSMLTPTNPWENLEKEQRRIKQEIAQISRLYLPGHRKMVELNKELDAVSQALDLEYETASNRFEVEYSNLIEKRRDLEGKLPNYEQLSQKDQKVQLESSLYSAGQLAWGAMYSQMAKELQTLDFTNEKERVNLEFLGLSEMKSEAVSPNRAKLLMIALFASACLGAGIPLLIEYLDHTISNFEEVEATFQMRGLGIVPQMEGDRTSEKPVLLDLEESGEKNIVENFRVIRTNLLSMGTLTKNPQVLMVTSAMPKEGKTVVSSNLALSFAQMGAKTLIIDADLRRGRLHRLFGLRKQPGLSELLLEKATFEEACRPTGKENLTIISAGEHLSSGTELLGSIKFERLMVELRSKFDRIIVDTPPVLGLSETSILQNFVDGVLFVVWTGRTPIRNMKTAIQVLQSNGANLYGFVLNRLDLSATTNYYQYYYYSNDYYYNYHALENA